MRFDAECSWVYDDRYGLDQLSAVGGCVKRWIRWGGCGAVLRCDMETHVDRLYIPCTKEKVYAHRLASIVRRNLSLVDDAPATRTLDHVA